jgi:hypothetical protein
MKPIRVLRADGRVIHVADTPRAQALHMAQRRPHQTWVAQIAFSVKRYFGSKSHGRRK